MIKININGVWTLAGDKYTSIFQKYVNQNRLYREVPYIEDGITISRDSNDPYNASYIHIGNHKIPICDWNNVKVFLLEMEPVDWHNARDYQTWAYYDFMYDNKQRKTYATKYSTYLAYPPHTREVTEIDIDDLQPNIIFLTGLKILTLSFANCKKSLSVDIIVTLLSLKVSVAK